MSNDEYPASAGARRSVTSTLETKSAIESWAEVRRTVRSLLGPRPTADELEEIDLWVARGFIPSLCLDAVNRALGTEEYIKGLAKLSLSIAKAHARKGHRYHGRSKAL